MAKAYSMDLRMRVVMLFKEGFLRKEISKILTICLSTVYKWLKKDQKGLLEPKKNWQKGYGNKIIDVDEFTRFATVNCYLTSKEMAAKWGGISAKTILKYLKRINFTRKKKLSATKKQILQTVKFL